MKTAAEVIEIARSHLGQGHMVTSARACLEDAERLLAAGLEADAKRRARHSIVYSVGVFHPDYLNSN